VKLADFGMTPKQSHFWQKLAALDGPRIAASIQAPEQSSGWLGWPSDMEDHAMPNPAPVTPPTLPPDFPDIPQNPSSELQPPSDPSATPDKVAGTIPSSEDDDRSDAALRAVRQLEQ
jgi:hypothetical protein